MQILHITDNLKVGGSQLVLVDLANQQAAAGHRVAIAAGSGELWAELAPEIVRYEHSSERLSRRVLLPVVRRLLKARRWDIVHTHQRAFLRPSGSLATVSTLLMSSTCTPYSRISRSAAALFAAMHSSPAEARSPRC